MKSTNLVDVGDGGSGDGLVVVLVGWWAAHQCIVARGHREAVSSAGRHSCAVGSVDDVDV